MSDTAKVLIMGTACIIASLPISYALAQIGYPNAVWLWCSMLKAC